MTRLPFNVNSNALRKYFFNTGWLLSDRIFRLFFGVLIGFWVARFLGPESFGILSYSQALIAIMLAFSNIGLNEILVREFINQRDREDEILGTSILFRFIGALIILTLLYSNYFLNNSSTNLILLILGVSMIFQSFRALNFYFQSLVLGKYVAITSVMALVISSIFKVILILFNAPLPFFAGAIVLDSFLVFIGLLYFYLNNRKQKGKWKINFDLAKYLIKNSWPLILSAILISVYMKIDLVMIKSLLDNESVGNYAAAAKISEAWGFIPSAIIASTFPAIINSKNTLSEELYNSRMQRLYSLMILVAILVAVPITFFAPLIISLAYGNEYLLASDVLVVHIWSCIFVFIGGASSKWLLAENLQKYFAINTGIGAAVNIFLNYILINAYGIIGAAWSTLISYSIAAFLALFLWKKTRKNFYNLTEAMKVYKIFKVE